MLTNQTVQLLKAMKLSAMANEYARQSNYPDMSALDFDERLGMMVDAEWLSRENNKVCKLKKEANLRFSTASFADIDYRPSRKLERAAIARLSNFAWVKEARNIILTGCTGTGKTWLACAFGAEACNIGLKVRFYRVNRLLNEMAVASNEGRLLQVLNKLKKFDILILDDFGLSNLNSIEGRFLLELFDDRYNERSTIISAQLPVSVWHSLFQDPTIADAVLDRVIHNANRFELQGNSLRPSEKDSKE